MLLVLLRKLLASKYGKHIGLDAMAVVLVFGSYIAVKIFHHDPVTSTVQVTPEVKVVTVDKPVLTEKLVEKIVSDPKDKALIAKLMADNKKLTASVTSLTQTVASLHVSGGGQVVAETLPATTTPLGATYHFKDFRLDFRTDTKTATYDLTQKFEILTTTGRQKDGQPVSLVNLFELDGDGNRLPVTDVKTVAVFADQTAVHWFTHLNLQAGLAVTQNTNNVQANGGVAALQWLKRGRSKATEDITFAALSPAFFVSQNVKEPGVLPFSVNLGAIPHQPLTNLWLSPYIGFNVASRSLSRAGLVVSATF